MRRFLPVKVFRRACASRAVAQAFAISTLLLVSTPCLASRHRKVPIPSPSPGPIQAVTQDKKSALSVFLSFLALGAFGGMGFWIYRLERTLSEVQASSDESIRQLKFDREDARSQLSVTKVKLRDVHDDLHHERASLDLKAEELERAERDLVELKAQLQEMIEADSTILEKAKKFREGQLKAEADRKAREEAAAAKKRIESEGKEMVGKLLTSMKRGY